MSLRADKTEARPQNRGHTSNVSNVRPASSTKAVCVHACMLVHVGTHYVCVCVCKSSKVRVRPDLGRLACLLFFF